MKQLLSCHNHGELHTQPLYTIALNHFLPSWDTQKIRCRNHSFLTCCSVVSYTFLRTSLPPRDTMPKTLPNQNMSKLYCPTAEKSQPRDNSFGNQRWVHGHTSLDKYGVTKGKITYTCIIFKSYLNLLTVRPKWTLWN